MSRIRPGVLSLLLILLFAGEGWVSVSRVMAQSSLPGGIVLAPDSAGFVSNPKKLRAQPTGERNGRAKEALPSPERADQDMPGPGEGEKRDARRGWLKDETPSAGGEEAQYIGSVREAEQEGGLEFEEGEDGYVSFGEGDDIIVERFDEGPDAVDPAPPAQAKELAGRFERPIGAVVEGQGEEPADLIGMKKGLLLPQRLSDPKASLGLTIGRYRYPDQLMEPHWTDCLEVLGDGSTDSLQSSLNRLYEAKLDAGFRNMPDYATLLIRRAYRLLETGEFLEARLLGEAAYNLAPEYYPVSSSLSDFAGKGPQGSVVKCLYWRWISLKQKLRDFLWQFTSAGKTFALVLMALYLFFLVLGFYFLGRYGRELLHFVKEILPVGPFGMAAVASALLATVLVLLFLPGPFWVTVFLGFLAGRFVRRWEKICYGLFLLLWAASPWLFNQAVCFFSPLSDATNSIQRCMQGEWNAAGEEALNAALRTDPESLDLQLTRALVEKRRGNYEEAAQTLRKALVKHPEAGSLWNNLGNLDAIQGNLQEAKAAYLKAVLYGNGSAAPHYNLSLLLRREFSFLKGAQEYHEARKIDAERVDYFTYIHSPNPNRFFMDEEPPKAALWRHAFYRDSETERAADDVWRSTAAGIPLRQAPWVFLSLAGVYAVLVARRSSGREPFACSGCGQIVCRKCDAGAEVGGLCSPCYQALYQKENTSKERRHGQIRKMARYQSRRSRRLLMLNLLLPGLGFSLLEETSRGMLILLGFFLFLLLAGFWANMLPVPMTVWETGGSFVTRILSLLLLVALYGLIQQRFVTKLRARR